MYIQGAHYYLLNPNIAHEVNLFLYCSVFYDIQD